MKIPTFKTFPEFRNYAVKRSSELRKEILDLESELNYLQHRLSNITADEKKSISVIWDGRLSVTGKLVHWNTEKQELILQLFDPDSNQPYVYTGVDSLKELGSIAAAAGLKRFFVEQRIKHPRIRGARVPVTLFPTGEVEVLQGSVVGVGEVERQLGVIS